VRDVLYCMGTDRGSWLQTEPERRRSGPEFAVVHFNHVARVSWNSCTTSRQCKALTWTIRVHPQKAYHVHSVYVTPSDLESSFSTDTTFNSLTSQPRTLFDSLVNTSHLVVNTGDRTASDSWNDRQGHTRSLKVTDIAAIRYAQATMISY